MKHLAAAALLLLFCSCESESPREAIDKGNILYRNPASKAPEAKSVIDSLLLQSTRTW
jgi:hypothetical protein